MTIMIAHLLTSVLSLSGIGAYLVVGGLALGEAAAFLGLVLPGETALLYGGVLAGRGNVSLPVMLAVAITAAAVGDSIGYEFGRRVGPSLRQSRAGRWVGETRWARAERFLARRGGSAVLLGRWVGLLRALVPTLAGMGRMPYRTFLLWNVAGGITWASTLVGLGYAFAGSVSALVGAVASVGTALTILTGLGVASTIAARWLRGRWSTLRVRAGGLASSLVPGGVLAAVTLSVLIAGSLLDDRWSMLS